MPWLFNTGKAASPDLRIKAPTRSKSSMRFTQPLPTLSTLQIFSIIWTISASPDFAVKGDWDLLRQHLEKGRPLIVALKPAKGEPSLHYVVVVGLDWNTNLLLINDPAQKKLLKVERRSFENEWKAVGDWTLLAVPR